jgi:hypothetical protein
MLAARITLPHFSVSSAMNFPNLSESSAQGLPQLNERDQDKASTHLNSMFEKLRNSRGSPGQAA